MAQRATVARPRSARGHGTLLRADLLEAARALLDESRDPAAVSLRAVAARAGVSPSAVYLHFADRDELLVSVVEEGFGAFQRAIDAADPGGDPLVRLVRRGEAYVRFAVDHPGQYRLLFGRVGLSGDRPDLNERCSRAGLEAFGSLVEVVQDCMDHRRLAPRDPGTVAVGFWSLVHGYADLAIAMQPDLPPIEQTLGAFVGALTGHRPGWP